VRVRGKTITVTHGHLAEGPSRIDFDTVCADGVHIGGVGPSDEGGWSGFTKDGKPLCEDGFNYRVLRKATRRGAARAVAEHVLLGRYDTLQ
jgi:hypothetical protein